MDVGKLKKHSSFMLLLCLVLSLAMAAAGCRSLSGRGVYQQPASGSVSSEQQPLAVQQGSGTSGQPAAGASRKDIVPYRIMGVSNRMNTKELLSMNRWRDDMVRLAAQNSGELFLNGPPDQRAVCLTFDDGPDGVFTPKVLDTLEQYGVHGSFFCIGQNVPRFPGVIRRVDRDGSLVLSHTWDHADLSRLSDQGIRKEITRTGDEIASVIGKHPAIVRPPYGAVNGRVINDLQGANYKIVIWSIDTLDWSQKDKENIARNVLDNVRPGDIILMHCNAGRQATVDALPEVITGLQARGYSFWTLSQMLGIPAYQ